MPKDIFGNKINYNLYSNPLKKEKKRVKLTPAQRIHIWEHPTKYGRKCSICGGRITKLSDLELEHTRAFSKGGSKMRLAHKECNRMKGSKSLSYVQTKMGFKKQKRVRKKTKKEKSSKVSTWINPLTGKKEKFNPWGL